jgi:hypothetical protein
MNELRERNSKPPHRYFMLLLQTDDERVLCGYSYAKVSNSRSVANLRASTIAVKKTVLPLPA